MRSVLFGLALFVLGGCGHEAVDAASEAASVYVGAATGAERSAQTLVALAIQDGHLRFFACGDEPTETTTAWVDVYDVDTAMAESPFLSDGTAGWQLDGVIASGWASGTLSKASTAEVLHWDALAVPGDDPSGPGLYTDAGTCETGVVVSETGAVQGSYCAVQYRAQVDPLRPVAQGFLVRLDPGTETVVQRVFAQ